MVGRSAEKPRTVEWIYAISWMMMPPDCRGPHDLGPQTFLWTAAHLQWRRLSVVHVSFLQMKVKSLAKYSEEDLRTWSYDFMSLP